LTGAAWLQRKLGRVLNYDRSLHRSVLTPIACDPRLRELSENVPIAALELIAQLFLRGHCSAGGERKVWTATRRPRLAFLDATHGEPINDVGTMGWLMTIPKALIALVIVLPIGLLGAWLRRVVTRAYRRDLTGWMALASGVLLGLAVATAYWPPVNHQKITTAIIFVVLSSLAGFMSLGALTLGRNAPALIMGALYCVLALPLIAATIYLVFVLAWADAHLDLYGPLLTR